MGVGVWAGLAEGLGRVWGLGLIIKPIHQQINLHFLKQLIINFYHTEKLNLFNLIPNLKTNPIPTPSLMILILITQQQTGSKQSNILHQKGHRNKLFTMVQSRNIRHTLQSNIKNNNSLNKACSMFLSHQNRNRSQEHDQAKNNITMDLIENWSKCAIVLDCLEQDA